MRRFTVHKRLMPVIDSRLSQAFVPLTCSKNLCMRITRVVVQGLYSFIQAFFAQLLYNFRLRYRSLVHPLHRAYNYYYEVYEGVIL